jgi:hypothetical protein
MSTPPKPGVDPASIPNNERLATLQVVWTKAGQIYTSYPVEPYYSLPMISAALDAVVKSKAGITPPHVMESISVLLRYCADIEGTAARMAQQQKEPLIVPATNIPANIDPRFLRKPN